MDRLGGGADLNLSTVLPDSTTYPASNEEEAIGAGILIVLVIICVFGVIGNVLIIFVVLALQEYKKTVTCWYVLQLAVADSLFLSTIPFKVVEQLNQEWRLPRGMCKTTESVLFLNYYASVFFLMVMSVDRYIAVCQDRSNMFQKLRTRRSAYIITCTLWVTSLVFCLPIFLYSDKRGFSPNCMCSYAFPRYHGEYEAEAHCAAAMNETETNDYEYYYYDYEGSGNDNTTLDTEHIYERDCSYIHQGEGWFHFLNFLFVVAFLLPLLVMSTCYALIIHQLQKTRRRASSGSFSTMSGERRRTLSTTALKTKRHFQRINIICIVLVLLFVVCWLPFHAFHIAMRHGIKGSNKYCKGVLLAVSLLAYINSALNPIVYNCLGRGFGTRLRSAAYSVKTSVLQQRTASLSSSGGGRVRHKSRHGVNSSVSETVIVRIRGKSEASSSREQDDCLNSDRYAMSVQEQSG